MNRSPMGSASLGQFRVPKTAELVAAELRRRIVKGELKEGDCLASESQLIETFGISRPTLREAYRILEAERLISISRGARGGATVHRPSVEAAARYAGLYLQWQNTTLSEIHEAQLVVLPPAARMFADRRPRKWLSLLKQHLERLEELIEDSSAYFRTSSEFYLVILKGSGNEALTLLGHLLLNVMEAHLNSLGSRYDVALAKRSIRSETKLVRLIEGGDGEAAEAHLREHIVNVGRITLKHFGAKSIIEVLS